LEKASFLLSLIGIINGQLTGMTLLDDCGGAVVILRKL
jgi:hypothetical protein